MNHLLLGTLLSLKRQTMRKFHEANNPPSSVEVKNEWSYTSTPFIRFRGVGSDIFTFISLPALTLGLLYSSV